MKLQALLACISWRLSSDTGGNPSVTGRFPSQRASIAERHYHDVTIFWGPTWCPALLLLPLPGTPAIHPRCQMEAHLPSSGWRSPSGKQSKSEKKVTISYNTVQCIAVHCSTRYSTRYRTRYRTQYRVQYTIQHRLQYTAEYITQYSTAQHGTIQCNTILTLSEPGLTKQTPHTSPSRASYGVSVVRRKYYKIISSPSYIGIHITNGV